VRIPEHFDRLSAAEWNGRETMLARRVRPGTVFAMRTFVSTVAAAASINVRIAALT